VATTETDLTYAGRRLTRRGPLAYFYAQTDSSDLRGFEKPLVTGTKIGTIVRITEEEDGSYYVGGDQRPRVIGQAPDSADLLRWSVAQEADVAEHAIRAREKRMVAEGNDPLRKRLEPIRNELATLPAASRAATIGWIVSYLTSGR
jgi:hypothetical protein